MILLVSLLILGGCSQSSNSTQDSTNTPESLPPVAKIKKYYAYSAAQYTNLIHEFSISETTGELTPLATDSIAGQTLPMITAASADKKVLLASNYSSNSVSSYLIDPNTGNLTLAENHALAAGSAPGWVTAHPKLNVFYTADSGTNKISILDVDANGIITIRGTVNAGAGATCIVINEAGNTLYSVDQGADQISIYNIDSDGNLTFANSVSVGTGSQPNQAALSPDGRFLYTANWGTQSVSSFSVSGNTLISIETVSAGTGGVYTVAVTPDGSQVYAAMPYGNAYAAFAVNAVTGALGAAQVTSLPGSASFNFWKDFTLILSWTGNAAGLPIETHSYSQADSLSASPTGVTTASYQGLYQLTIVEVEVDP